MVFGIFDGFWFECLFIIEYFFEGFNLLVGGSIEFLFLGDVFFLKVVFKGGNVMLLVGKLGELEVWLLGYCVFSLLGVVGWEVLLFWLVLL